MEYGRKWERRIQSLRECLKKVSQGTHLSEDLEEVREGTMEMSWGQWREFQVEET